MIFLVLCPDFAFFDWFSARALLYLGSLLALPGCHILNVPVFFRQCFPRFKIIMIPTYDTNHVCFIASRPPCPAGLVLVAL